MKTRKLTVMIKSMASYLTAKSNKPEPSLLKLVGSVGILIGLIIAPTIAQTKSARVIVVMDSPTLAYDDENITKGRSNPDEIRDILSGIPRLSIMVESTSLEWRREDQVRAMKPALIIMHWSAFAANVRLHETLADEQKKFISFLKHIAIFSPKTQFLIYTREPFHDAAGRRDFINAYERKIPQLKGRIQLFEFPGEPEKFRDPMTRDALRTHVQNILGLSKSSHR